MSAVRQGGAARRVVHQGLAVDEEDVSSCESSACTINCLCYPLVAICCILCQVIDANVPVTFCPYSSYYCSAALITYQTCIISNLLLFFSFCKSDTRIILVQVFLVFKVLGLRICDRWRQCRRQVYHTFSILVVYSSITNCLASLCMLSGLSEKVEST